MATPIGDTECVLMKQGAEAKIYKAEFFGKPAIIKERFSKKYRHPSLDKSLTLQRTKSEVRSMMRCRMNGIRTPAVYHVDLEDHKIVMEHLVESITVKDHINSVQSKNKGGSLEELFPLAKVVGDTLANMHSKNIIHGDLTTSNMLLKTPVSRDNPELVMIDFGLGYVGNVAEDKGVDLYVLERALLSTHPNTESLFELLMSSYKTVYGKGAQEILNKFEEVRLRGRKRTMIG